jgi:hypothetical protein
MEVNLTAWSGEGEFTQLLVDALRRIDRISLIRVEDAPASRAEAAFSFISNEVYLAFQTRLVREPVRRLGFLPGTRRVARKACSLEEVESELAAAAGIGPPDYADPGMLQYLRSQRIIPPYQTRGFKLVELVRVYEVATGETGGGPVT